MTLQENLTQFERVLAGFWWPLTAPDVEVMYRISPMVPDASWPLSAEVPPGP